MAREDSRARGPLGGGFVDLLAPPRLGWFIHIPFLAHSMCWGLGGAVMEYNDRRRLLHIHTQNLVLRSSVMFLHGKVVWGVLSPGAPPILLKDKIKKMTTHWPTLLCMTANVPDPAQVPHTVPQPSLHTSAYVTTVSPGFLHEPPCLPPQGTGSSYHFQSLHPDRSNTVP